MVALTSLTSTGDKSWVAFLTCVVWTCHSLAISRFSASATLALAPLVCVLAWAVCRFSSGVYPAGQKYLASDGSNRSLLARLQRADGAARGPAPRFRLVAHPVTTYGEKVRWILDLLAADYEEHDVPAGVSALLRRRTIPWLVDAVGDARINNSTEIICYLGAVHVPLMPAESRARAEAFLRRTPEAMRWEAKLQAMGTDALGWAYSLIHNPANGFPSDAIKLLWGASDPTIPVLDRLFFRAAWPLVFRWIATLGIDCSAGTQKVRMARLQSVLDEVDAALARSGNMYIQGPTLTYVDIDFAAMWAPWLPATTMSTAPTKFANGRFTSLGRFLEKVPWPEEMARFERELMARPCGQLIRRVYAEFRGAKL